MIVRKNTLYLSVRLFISRREWEEHMARGSWQPSYEDLKTQKKENSELLIFVIIGIFLIILQLIIVQDKLLGRTNLMQMKYQREYNLMREKVQNLTFQEQMDLVNERISLSEEERKRRVFNGKYKLLQSSLYRVKHII